MGNCASVTEDPGSMPENPLSLSAYENGNDISSTSNVLRDQPDKKYILDLQHDPADYPYLHVMQSVDPLYLDWRRDLTTEEITTSASLQARLPCEVMPYLFLSHRAGVRNIKRLEELGITHVLNVGGKPARGPISAYKKAGITYKEIQAKDAIGYEMLKHHFWECNEFINSALCPTTSNKNSSNGDNAEAKTKRHAKVVVHCQAGVNRSGVIVASQLIVRERKTLLQAMNHGRKCRGNRFCYTNKTFLKELIALSKLEGLLDGRDELPKEVRDMTPQ